MAIKFEDEDNLISEINITPLTDVALVLLIIFMVTTPLIMQAGIKIALPKTMTSEVSESGRIIITLTKDNKIYLNDVEIKIEKLSGILKKQIENNSEKIVIINADKDVPHGSVVNILDISKQVGVKNLGIATIKK